MTSRRARPSGLAIRDIMTADLVTVTPELGLRETVDLFATRHLSGAPVVTEKRVVGVVSAADLLEFQAATPAVPVERRDQVELEEWKAADEWEEGSEPPSAYFSEWWSDVGADVAERFGEVGSPEWDVLAEHTVAEVMNRSVCALPPDADVRRAARYMLEAGVHRLLVMDRGRLLGILTTTDIVRAVADGRLGPG